jgi:hypothetical protein
MKKIPKKISNPMTIIAIFATLSETSAAVSLPFLGDDEREVYVWFLISFPFYLLFLFFLTLNFNYRSLYAPSDFAEDKSFLTILDDAERPSSAKSEEREGAFARLRSKVPPSPRQLWRPGYSAQDSPTHIHLQTRTGVQHSFHLPGPLKKLQIIDTRGMNTAEDFGTLMHGIHSPRGHPAKAIVFLACNKSQKLLQAGLLAYSQQQHKDICAFSVVYNLSSLAVTVLDQTEDE